MFDTGELPELKKAISDRAKADKKLLDELRGEVRSFACDVRTIKPRTATAVSLVASDGGNNKLMFDPFYVQLVRVMDSYGKQLCLDAVSPTTDTDILSKNQFNADGTPRTALGKMMVGLGVNPPTINKLCHMIPSGKQIREDPDSVKPGWVMVYRDLCEWAVLYERICCDSFATDTLIVRDGLLRSKIFRGDFFIKWRKDVEEAIERIYRQDRRHIYLVGLAKHSNVIARYHLAMAIEGAFPPGDARYVQIPRNLEVKAYRWAEWARGVEIEGQEREAPKYVAGDMFLVRFGKHSGDPIWAVDIFSLHSKNSSEIFGYLLNDAICGFPVPFYPLCLQKAHNYAQIVDFDLEIFQDEIFSAVRELLPEEKRGIVDSLRLHSDLSSRRYE
jgi:hypothetical protein